MEMLIAPIGYSISKPRHKVQAKRTDTQLFEQRGGKCTKMNGFGLKNRRAYFAASISAFEANGGSRIPAFSKSLCGNPLFSSAQKQEVKPVFRKKMKFTTKIVEKFEIWCIIETYRNAAGIPPKTAKTKFSSDAAQMRGRKGKKWENILEPTGCAALLTPSLPRNWHTIWAVSAHTY